jgi:pimeloyl-ACP methyl ester carboxylesterase
MNNINFKLTVIFFMFFSHVAFAELPVLKTGTGVFSVEGGKGIEHLSIGVNYYKPKNFSKDSPILIVLPGNGRTGAKYRDRWIAASNKFGALILSLTYSKEFYPRTIHYTIARMSVENNGVYTNENNPSKWIYSDFDRIFDLVVASTKSSQLTYDLFGHSAGGQIGHRLAIFSPENKVNRIISANSGWYTATDFGTPFPYGFNDGPVEKTIMKTNLKASFAKKLIVFLGENDDENETRGSLRMRPLAVKQGAGRLDRGKYFFEKSKNLANELGYKFNWEIHVVPNVGHSSSKMSIAAAELLYNSQ